MRPGRIHGPATTTPNLVRELLLQLRQCLIREMDEIEVVDRHSCSGQPHPQRFRRISISASASAGDQRWAVSLRPLSGLLAPTGKTPVRGGGFRCGADSVNDSVHESIAEPARGACPSRDLDRGFKEGLAGAR